jgi:hypothetical protein
MIGRSSNMFFPFPAISKNIAKKSVSQISDPALPVNTDSFE